MEAFFLKKRISNKTRRLRYCAAAGKKKGSLRERVPRLPAKVEI